MFNYDASKANLEVRHVGTMTFIDENSEENVSQMYRIISDGNDGGLQVQTSDMDIEFIKTQIYSWASLYNFIENNQ